MNGGGRTLIVGLGTEFGDDLLGLIVAETLAPRLPTCDVRRLRSPLDVLDHLSGVAYMHIIDACRGAGPLGTIVRRDWPAPDLTAIRFSGTHDFSLLAALQLAERLQQLPPHVTIWSVEAADDDRCPRVMTPPSPVVAAAAEALSTRIAAEIDRRTAVTEEVMHHA